MVRGLESFKEHFKDCIDQYVIIGGTACDTVLSNLNIRFRETKDIDMVLMLEALNLKFGVTFWKYIKDAQYSHIEKTTGKTEHYRFYKPSSIGNYPYMIELLSRTPDCVVLPKKTRITPIPFESYVKSLSAILLDDLYYSFLKTGRIIHNNLSVLHQDYLVLFKIKAWLNLNQERILNPRNVKSRDLNKHKNDVIRLSQALNPSEPIYVPEEVYHDIQSFINAMDMENFEPWQLKIPLGKQYVLDIINEKYRLQKQQKIEATYDFSL